MAEPVPVPIESPRRAEQLSAVAARAASHWGLPAPTLIRVGSTGVFRAADVVLRVAAGTTTSPAASLALADRLGAAGVRVARPARPDVWREADGTSVTAWEAIELDVGAPIDWEHVGAMIAAVHRLEPRSFDPPLEFCGDVPWWDFTAMLAIEDAGVRKILGPVVAQHGWWSDTARRGRLVVCHGDVHPGNVLVATDGPVLIDWDLIGVAPREWDHAPLSTWTARWGGAPGIYEAFAAGYGQTVDPAMLDAIAELRLVAATLMRLRSARVDPTQRAEAERRLRYWRGEADAPSWVAQ